MMCATPTVSGLYAGSLAAFLRERGLQPTEQGPQDDLAAPSHLHRVAGQAYALALQHGSRELGDAALGLSFGTRIGGAGFGLLGVAAVTAPTLRQSIHHLMRLEALTSTLGHVAPRREGQLVHLEWRPVQALSPAVIEGILSGWVSFGRYFLGEHADVCAVSFAHRRIAALQAYEGVFECPVRFDAERYSVTIAADLLDARPLHADATLNTALDHWLGVCATAVTPGLRVMTRRIADLLGSEVAFTDANEDSIAARLGIRRRSLQRRLQEEGTRFRHVLDAARAQHAIVGLLSGQCSLVELAANSGFDEQSSLCRSFRKWTGYAPLAFRGKLGGMFSALRDDATPEPLQRASLSQS